MASFVDFAFVAAASATADFTAARSAFLFGGRNAFGAIPSGNRADASASTPLDADGDDGPDLALQLFVRDAEPDL